MEEPSELRPHPNEYCCFALVRTQRNLVKVLVFCSVCRDILRKVGIGIEYGVNNEEWKAWGAVVPKKHALLGAAYAVQGGCRQEIIDGETLG